MIERPSEETKDEPRGLGCTEVVMRRFRVTWRGIWIYRRSETWVFLWWHTQWHWKPCLEPGLGIGGWMFYWIKISVERVVFDNDDWGEQAADDLATMFQCLMDSEA